MNLYRIFIILCISTFVSANTCEKKDILSKFQAVRDNIELQAKKIDRILLGEKVEGYSAQMFFGHDFTLDKTEARVQELTKVINEEQSVLIENSSMNECLLNLGLETQREKLAQVTKQLLLKKIELLEKNKEFNDSIRETGIAETGLPEIKSKIDKDSSEAIRTKNTLENSLIKKQSITLVEKNSDKREILEYENNLTKIKIQLLNKKIELNRNLETKIKQFEELSTQLKLISSTKVMQESDKLFNNFQKVEEMWLSLSSENYFELFYINGALDLPELPKALDQKKYVVDISSVVSLRNEIVELRKDIIKSITEKKNQELKLLNNLVSNSSSIRESYYKKMGFYFFLKSFQSLEFFKLIKNEIMSSPYRVVSYFYSKYLYVREQISLGKEGYVSLFKNAIFLVFLVGVFFALKYSYQRVVALIDDSFQYFFRQRRRGILVEKSFFLWTKLKDSFSLVLWFLSLVIIENLGLVDDLILVVKIAEVYLAANILKHLLTLFLGSVSRLDSGNFVQFKKKSAETSNKFKNIFLFYFYTMFFIEATVGKVYIYTLLNYFIFIYSIYHFVREMERWEIEFRKYSERMFAGIIVKRFFRVLEFTPKKLRSSLLLIFILSFMLFDFFAGITEKFEISKKISANLFKKQIENVEAGEGADNKIPNDYKENFSLKSTSLEDEYVSINSKIEESMINEVNEWLEEKSDEHSLVIYGDKGIGKTTLLKRVATAIEDKKVADVSYVKMPSKTISKKKLYEFIAASLGLEGEGIVNIDEVDAKLTTKKVIVIDECQNIFLSQNGGFNAYYELINIINLNTKNIFWVMSFNKYSWLYLDRAFGRNQFFRNVFELTGWSDAKIKELIMKRHNKTQYKLSFDLLISATRSQDELDKYASVESKFFKLLWELSRGNPRSALYLWMTALSRKSKNKFNVNIPKEVELEGLEKMPEELLFVIAHVLKHENLSFNEIHSTTNLQKGLVRNAIKLGQERNFFFKDERDRYMVDITTQYGLIRILRVKNFIYGN